MLPRNCQMLLFSATFEDSVWKFAQKVKRSAFLFFVFFDKRLLYIIFPVAPDGWVASNMKAPGAKQTFVKSSYSALSSLQCLCLSPTYELALQTGKVIEQMGKFYPELKLAYAVRGNKCEYEYVGLDHK